MAQTDRYYQINNGTVVRMTPGMNSRQNATTDNAYQGGNPVAQTPYSDRDPRIPPQQPAPAPAPAPAPGSAAAANAARFPTQAPGAAPGAQQTQTLQDQRYNWDSPEFALMNALRDQGARGTAGQPYLDVLMRAAPGLANAFRINSAMSGAGGNAQMDPQAAYGEFLRGAITGGVGGSGVVGALRSAQNQMPSLLGMLRSYSDSISQGGQGQNWAMNSLLTDMGQNSSMGAADVLAELSTPLMNRTTATGFQNRLSGPMGIAAEAMRRYMDPLGNRIVNGLPQNDYWRYLFGY